MRWLWNLTPGFWYSQRNLSKAQIWSCHLPASNPAVCPVAYRIKSRPSEGIEVLHNLDPAHLCRLLSCCVLSHNLCSSDFKLLASPPTDWVCLGTRGFTHAATFACNYPHDRNTHTHAHTAPFNELPSIFQKPAKEAFPALWAELTTPRFMPPPHTALIKHLSLGY